MPAGKHRHHPDSESCPVARIDVIPVEGRPLPAGKSRHHPDSESYPVARIDVIRRNRTIYGLRALPDSKNQLTAGKHRHHPRRRTVYGLRAMPASNSLPGGKIVVVGRRPIPAPGSILASGDLGHFCRAE